MLSVKERHRERTVKEGYRRMDNATVGSEKAGGRVSRHRCFARFCCSMHLMAPTIHLRTLLELRSQSHAPASSCQGRFVYLLVSAFFREQGGELPQKPRGLSIRHLRLGLVQFVHGRFVCFERLQFMFETMFSMKKRFGDFSPAVIPLTGHPTAGGPPPLPQ
ncbi:hypothetical protein R1flu_022022 [Riccia fluitans]|uniref:Uncharacterized protein n=1 Tax=Riccia fluitans TaxID=41844 RepID=A0ABD1ZR33_9MARC